MGNYLCCCFKASTSPPPSQSQSHSQKTNLVALKHSMNIEKIPLFSLKGKSFIAIPCNIYDGDTLSMVFYLDNRTLVKYRCRCLGYDSPEMKPALKNPNREAEKIAAVNAKNRFIELLHKNADGTVRIECHEFDKYGRLLVEIYNEIDTMSVNKIMIAEGHGYPYEGGTKQAFVGSDSSDKSDEMMVLVDVD